ncbi:sensor histidine kinase [Cytophaga aurantiaca]|uniref:sensor histidine kinase n=1 Tax=Cytophaga aurantiaca TaxID=29530 RepID=UPI000376D7A2|nr:histidine kinase [Cytophaga aurantiaca]
MQHPLFVSKRKLYTYIFAWMPVLGIHAFIDIYIYKIPTTLSVIDAGISTGIFAMIGMLSWYTVRFISIDNTKILFTILNHFIAALLFITLWFFISNSILKILSNDFYFLNFIQTTTPFRIVIALFFYCILALSYYLYKYYSSYKARIEREAEWKTLVKEGELNLLKSQLQPHFIFNSLNSIHALMYQDMEKAQEMLTNLSSYLRLSIEKNKEKSVPFSEELQNGLLYCSIEKIRFGNRLDIETTISEDSLSCQAPFMILQPLLENAIKHGLFGFIGMVKIEIVSFVEDNALHILIKNNHDPSVHKQNGNGLGLTHVQHRFALSFGRKNLVKIKDENGIFQVELIIPQY